MARVAVIRYAGSAGPTALGVPEFTALLKSGLAHIAAGGNYTKMLTTLFGKGVTGIKTNCLAARNSTSAALVDAFCELLAGLAHVRDNDIIVWERSNRELQQAGFTLNASMKGRRCLGTDTNGIGYDERFFASGKVQTMVSRIITEMTDHSVNMPILKDHSIAGLSGALKNMFGAIRNPNKYHMNNCDPYVADVNGLEPIRAKHRLTVIDAVRVQYDRGPGFDPRSLSWYGGIILSTDPVAADAVALEILQGLRAANNRPELSRAGRPVKYLASAQAAGLGECDLRRIDVVVTRVDAHGNESKGELL